MCFEVIYCSRKIFFERLFCHLHFSELNTVEHFDKPAILLPHSTCVFWIMMSKPDCGYSPTDAITFRRMGRHRKNRLLLNRENLGSVPLIEAITACPVLYM